MALGFFGGALETDAGAGVFPGIDAVLFLEAFREVVREQLVEVVAAEFVVSVAGEDFRHVFLHPDYGNVEGAAAEIIDQEGALFSRFAAVGETGRRGFIEDAHDFESGQLAGLAGGLALGIGEVRRDGDNRFFDFVAQGAFRPRDQFPQNKRRYLLRREFPAAQGQLLVAAHEPLDTAHGPFGIKQLLVPRAFSHQELAVRCEADARGQEFVRAGRNQSYFAVQERGDFRVGGSQVDADYAFPAVHVLVSPSEVVTLGRDTFTSANR